MLLCLLSVYTPNTHHRYMEWSHGACNAYCRGGCGFSYDSMHIREFATVVLTTFIPIHQVKRCPDGQGDTGAGVKDPVTKCDSWQQL